MAVPTIEGYEIYEPLGSGAMGTVFRARQLSMDRIVALKIIKRSFSRTRRQVERLRREGKLVASLDHPNIVKGFDLGESGGYYYLTMEYVAGRSVKAMIKEKVFSETDALDVAEKVVMALDHAAELGVIHRDLKPANIMITWDGLVKIADLGLAKGPANPGITHSGATIGTPQYLSPEQAQDPRHVDQRSDFYSLGATLFHMVVGRPPFSGEGIAEVITKVLFTQPERPRALSPDLTQGMDNLILCLMAKEPDQRPSNAGALLDLIDRVRRGESISSPEQENRVEQPKLARSPFKSGVFLGAMTTVTIVAAVLLLRLVFFSDDGRQETDSTQAPTLSEEAQFDRKIQDLDARSRGAVFPEIFSLLEEVSELSASTEQFDEEEALAFSERLRKTRSQLKRRITSTLSGVFREVEQQSLSLIVDGEFRDALASFGPGLEESVFARNLGDKLAIGMDQLPEDLFAQVEGRRDEGENRIRSHVSRELVQRLIDELEGTESMTEGFSGQINTIDRVEQRLRNDQDLVLGTDYARIDDRIHDLRMSVQLAWERDYRSRETDVLDAADRRDFRDARDRIEGLGEDGVFSAIPRLVARQEELRSEINDRERIAALDEEQRQQRFDRDFPELMTSRSFSRVQGLIRDRLEMLGPLALQSDRISDLLRRTENARHYLELVQSVRQKLLLKLTDLQGKKTRLSVKGDRNEREVLSVQNGIVRYRYTRSGNISTFSMDDLDLQEVREIFAVSSALDAAALSMYVLDRARGEDDLARKMKLVEESGRDLSHARSLLASSGRAAPWFESWLPFAEQTLAKVDRAARAKGEEQEREGQALLTSAEEALEQERYKDALGTFHSLRDDPWTRGVYLRLRDDVDEKISACVQALRLADLRGQFTGKVLPAKGRNRVRLEYDFSEPTQLNDWLGGARRFSIAGGVLHCSPPAGKMTGPRFKVSPGIQHRGRFDLFRGVRLEFDYIVSEDPEPFFLVLSILGNNLGVLSRGQAGESRKGQLNTWIGSIEDYESFFHLAGRFLREPRGIREFRFEAGKTHRVALTITDYARLIRFEVDGAVVLERELLKSRREGLIEIRSWFGHKFDNLVVEGVME